MKFVEAVQAMKERKKVQRKNWLFSPISLDELGFVEFTDKSKYQVSPTDVEATDWEIIEKTLSDRIQFGQEVVQSSDSELREGFIPTNDVKESLKKFCSEMIVLTLNAKPNIIAKEIFGERLV